MEVTIDEIQKKFDGLPEDLKWAIMAAKVDDNVIDIGHEHGLNVEQTGQLSLETHMVMFGFTHPDKFEESLKGSLQLPDEKIKGIVNSVNEKILKNIREQLMALHGAKKDEPAQSAGKVTNTVEEEKNNTAILKSAQIEIMPEEITATNPNKEDINLNRGALGKNENRADILSKVENPSLINKETENQKTIQSVASQKLSGSFQIPTVKTEYTLNNISKQNQPQTQTSTPTTPKPNVDPYREIPE